MSKEKEKKLELNRICYENILEKKLERKIGLNRETLGGYRQVSRSFGIDWQCLAPELHANDRTRTRERVNDVRKLRKKRLTHPPSAFSHRCGTILWSCTHTYTYTYIRRIYSWWRRHRKPWPTLTSFDSCFKLLTIVVKRARLDNLDVVNAWRFCHRLCACVWAKSSQPVLRPGTPKVLLRDESWKVYRVLQLILAKKDEPRLRTFSKFHKNTEFLEIFFLNLSRVETRLTSTEVILIFRGQFC